MPRDRPAVPLGRTPDWHWLTHHPPETIPPALPLQATFANTGRYENGCSLLPSTGLAVLREADGDFTDQPDSTAAALSYGPYGGGHGHPDKLSLVVYAGGRQWLPLFGSMPYETHWKAEWTAHTVSHNTVVLDETSQKPAGERNAQWPADSAADRVLGRLEAFEPAQKRVAAVCDTAYPGVTLRRAVQVVGHLVVDDYRVEAQEPHAMDYVLHVDGELVAASPQLPARTGALGTKCGYQLLQQQAGGEVSGPAVLTFAAGKQRLRLWLVAMDDDPSAVILADGLTNSPQGHLPTVLVRRRAAQMHYVTVVEPVRDGRAVREVQPRDGRLTITFEDGSTRTVPVS
ncbi:MAG: heparinase II/III family protein [Armatimonadetes bacterium]|nr:heparinase II/III family protein [Armatimonadota bacterium]